MRIVTVGHHLVSFDNRRLVSFIVACRFLDIHPLVLVLRIRRLRPYDHAILLKVSWACQPTPSVRRHVVIAIPDYACFWNYQAWLGQQNNEGVLGIMIMNRENFREMFGYESERRTILSLAIHGRPSCLVSAVYSK